MSKSHNCVRNFLWLSLLLITTFHSWSPTAALSDQRLCADPNCQEVISLATAMISYTAGETGMVSFKINSQIRVKSKSAGSDPNLWGIEVNGRNGYAPKRFIMEKRILISENDLKFVVPVTMPDTPPIDSVGNASETLNGKADAPELTATATLDAKVVESVPTNLPDAKVTDAKGDNGAIAEKPTAPTSPSPSPVQQNEQIVDGTKIPILDEAASVNNNVSELPKQTKTNEDTPMTIQKNDNEEKKDNDDDVGVDDYDDGEIEADFKIDESVIVAPEVDLSSVSDKPANSGNMQSSTPQVLNVDAQKVDAKLKEDPQIPVRNAEGVNNIKEQVSDNKTVPPVEITANTNESSGDKVVNSEGVLSADIKVEKEATVDGNIKLTEVKPEEIVNNSSSPGDLKIENNVAEAKSAQAELDEKSSNVEQVNNIAARITKSEGDQGQQSSTPQVLNVDAQKVDAKQEQVSDTKTLPPVEVTANTNESTSDKVVNSEGVLSADIKVAPQPGKDATVDGNLKITEVKHDEIVNNSSSTGDLKVGNNIAETKSAQAELDEKSSNVEQVNNIAARIVTTEGGQRNEESIPQQVTPKSSITESGFASHYTDYNVDETTTLPTTSVDTPQEKVPSVTSDTTTDFMTTPSAPIENEKNIHESQQVPVQGEDVVKLDSTTAFTTYATVKESEQPIPNAQQVPRSDEAIVNYTKPDETTINTEKSETANPKIGMPEATVTPPLFQQLPLMPNQLPHHKEQHREENVNSNAYYRQSENSGIPDNQEQPAVPLQTGSNAQQPAEAGVNSDQIVISPSVVKPGPTLLPSQAPIELEHPREKGLFATILGTVNNLLSSDKKDPIIHDSHVEHVDEKLNQLLYPDRKSNKALEGDEAYCEKITPNDCPSAVLKHNQEASANTAYCQQISYSEMSFDDVVDMLAGRLLEMSELIVCLAIVAASTLCFIFGYYCFCNSSREGALLAKLNLLERSLLASQKENAILKHDLTQTRCKLSSIEDNSFGSNDMVIALKKELEEELVEKEKLHEQVSHLEKELEAAAEAGLELNKIVSELLSNQTGDDSIISSVEELQKQLNQQQNTILEINAVLAEKSRENSELQVMLSEQSARLNGEISSLQQDNDELEADKAILQTRLAEIKNEFDDDMKAALEGKNLEIKRLQNEIIQLESKIEDEHSKRQTSLAKVEALEECLKTVKRDPSVNITQVIDVANIRAELLDIQKKYNVIKERLHVETDARKLAETQLQIAVAEVEKLKQDFNQSEKDKLEAQTRLEVLSNYFKEKEMQLQKELSVKEAMWLKQQGETVSTVDRVTAMQEEVNSLKSQNDSLRAEIEAQLAAHKAQTGTLENRAHETWLAARQCERRYEEARAEAAALRRKLTALAGGNLTEGNRPPNAGIDGKIPDLNNAPSPIHMESPGSPMLGRLPPPPFLPPPFMGPFMGMPPPFVPPGEMRPPPLGRIMSPPLPGGSGPSRPARSGRYTPDHGDYDDYDDYDDEMIHRRRRNGNGSNWQRDSYSPPRTYRSNSPTDSRYNYTDRDLISTYDTETDFSPPASPRDRRSRGSRSGSYRAYSPPLTASSPIDGNGNKKQATANVNKGTLSSGSDSSRQKKSKGKSMV